MFQLFYSPSLVSFYSVIYFEIYFEKVPYALSSGLVCYYCYYGYCYYYYCYYYSYTYLAGCRATLIIVPDLIELPIVVIVFGNIQRYVRRCACSIVTFRRTPRFSNVLFGRTLRFSSSVGSARQIPLSDHDEQQQSDTRQLAKLVSYRRKFVAVDGATEVGSDL